MSECQIHTTPKLAGLWLQPPHGGRKRSGVLGSAGARLASARQVSRRPTPRGALAWRYRSMGGPSTPPDDPGAAYRMPGSNRVAPAPGASIGDALVSNGASRKPHNCLAQVPSFLASAVVSRFPWHARRVAHADRCGPHAPGSDPSTVAQDLARSLTSARSWC